MCPAKDKDGYLKLSLRGNNGTVYVRIATLVAYNFVGEPPKTMKQPTVDHIDGDITNNNFGNLRWLERGENSSLRKNRGKSAGELNHEAKLSEKDVVKICALLVENQLTLKEIADCFDVSKSTISNIRRKNTWRHLTAKYSFPEQNIIKDEKGRFCKIGSTGK